MRRPSCDRTRLSLLVLTTALAAPSSHLAALDPLAPVAIEPGSTTIDLQPAPAVDVLGRLLLAWTRRQAGVGDRVVAARLDADGHPVATPKIWGTGLALDNASLGRSFFALRGDGPHGGEWGQHLLADASEIDGPQPLGILQFLQVRSDPRGGAMAVGRGPDGAVGVRYGADGRPTDEPFVLERGVLRQDLGIDARGNLVLAFTRSPGGLSARRYTPAGKPIGASVPVAPAGASAFRIAVLRDGRFVVFYLKPLDFRVWARAFRANGKAVGPAFLVSRDLADTDDGLAVAVDDDGTVLVVWKGFPNSNRTAIGGRFVSASGVPIGAPFELGRTASEGPAAGVASPRGVRLAPGSFRVFWVRGGVLEEDVHLRSQRVFSGPGGDDPCIVQAGALRCDLRHDGGGAEVVVPLALGAGDLPLLGDFDGDRRDEPCLFRAHQFVCDLDKDGILETTYAYGEPGDTPLLGDLDGDGRTELCRFDGAGFRCAKLPLGSAPEIAIAFGGTDVRPALGDADGDGDDDPCVFVSGAFLCDTAHDGGSAESERTFALVFGEAAFVADLDGDGRADPCAAQAGRFRCLLSSTGRPQTLAFGGPQALPLLGNLDGR